MVLSGKVSLLGGILLLLISIALFIFRGTISNLMTPKTVPADSLDMVEKLTPEIEQLSLQIGQNPGNAALIFNRADAYFKAGNLKYAMIDYKKAYQLDLTNQAYTIGLADCYFEVNAVDSAIIILENFLRHDPENIDVLQELAINYFILPQPKYQLAIDKLGEILKIDNRNADAYFYLSLIYKETGDTLKAIRTMQSSVENNPDNYDAYMQLGLLYAEKGDPLAVKYFDNAILLNDSSKEAKYAKAKFMQDQGKLSDAIDYYNKIISQDPQDADAIYNLATIYFGIDSIEKAYRMFDLAIKQAPAKKEAYFGKGLCAEQLNNTEEAISYYKQALNLDPNYTDAENQLNTLKEKQK